MLAGLIFSVVPFFLVYQIITPLLMKEAIEPTKIILLVSGVALCGVLYALFYIKGLDLSHKSAFNTLKNLRVSLQKKLEAQPLGAIQDKGTGSMKKMFVDDIENIEVLLAHTLPEGLANLITPFIIFTGMFIVDWKLALLSLCALPIGIVAMGVMFKIGMKGMKKYYASAQKMNNTIVEYINGMEVVKVFNRDGESYHRFEKDVKSYCDFTLGWYKVCWPWMAIYASILPCIALFTLPFGTSFVLSGSTSLPDLVLVLCMAFSIGPMFLKALNFMSTLPQINYKIKTLEDMFNTPPLVRTDKAFEGKNHEIEFDNVRFAYNETEVLHGVSFKVKEGSLVALIGESGSGKSTLAKLLVHFYDVTDGAVKLGGQDIRDMSIEALNNEISYVSQEQFLFNTTLMENIRLGKLDATDAEVTAAAEKAQCGEFLARLPKGLATMAGDGGKQLSGGERQRISLARAILKNAPVIVLDEATAFMDPENEEKMNDAIAELIESKTVIVIAHRLQSIMHADAICVMEQGNLVAVGSHKDLLESCQVYQKLWKLAEESSEWKVSAADGGKN
jgi:ATP-binding cassette subfamily B protein